MKHNRLLKSKKALYFGLMMVLFTIIILITAFVVLSEKYKKAGGKGDEKIIGVKQLRVFDAYNKAEAAQLYLDYAVKYAADQAAVDVVESGAPSFDTGENSCSVAADDVNGYAVWATPVKECYPSASAVEKVFVTAFNNRIRQYTYSYNVPNVYLPNTFSVTLSGNTVYVQSVDDILVNFEDPQSLLPRSEVAGIVSVNDFMKNKAAQSAVMRCTGKRDPSLPVDYIVLHHTAGDTASGAISSWITKCDAYVADKKNPIGNAHYVIERDGTIISVVLEDRTAWHAGGGNVIPYMNTRSIGIEIVNCGAGSVATGDCSVGAAGVDPYPPAQVEAVRSLVISLIQKYNIPPSHIIGHWYALRTSERMKCEPCGFDYDFLRTTQGFESEEWRVKTG